MLQHVGHLQGGRRSSSREKEDKMRVLEGERGVAPEWGSGNETL
jgi:hypothetical protein